VSVLGLLKPRERSATLLLCDLADNHNVPAFDPVSAARSLSTWFDQEQSARAERAKVAFGIALSQAFRTNGAGTMWTYAEQLRAILIAAGDKMVLRHVILGEVEPDWNELAPRFAIEHAELTAGLTLAEIANG
jgi:hypothetical protein